jgi:hypothetical protein
MKPTGTYGERFIENKVEGNQVSRVHEWRMFPYDFEPLMQELCDYVSDDWEIHADHGIYYNRSEEIDFFEADSVLDWIQEYIENRKTEDEYEQGDLDYLEKWIKPLQEAAGFTIHLHWNPEWVKQTDKEGK